MAALGPLDYENHKKYVFCYVVNVTGGFSITIAFLRFHLLLSAPSGQHSIGTPAATTASSVEFQPQWVTNAPTAGWLRTSTCGAHDLRTRPRPCCLLGGPLQEPLRQQRVEVRLAVPLQVPHGVVGAGRRAHHPQEPPAAISLICSSDSEPLLPQQRNTTLRSAWAAARQATRGRGTRPATSCTDP
ncbi:hypothetical protein U9M48_040974 [Paspalum notatum var. saurae]|uniref:Uncharacterized protein n=1 Tax=Paspalum notatum var. saurae TaxID=547442 RepID=A0AAQ3US76_PASNO